MAYCCRSFMKLWRLPILTSGDTRVYTAMSFIRWKSALASSVRPGVCMYMWVCTCACIHRDECGSAYTRAGDYGVYHVFTSCKQKRGIINSSTVRQCKLFWSQFARYNSKWFTLQCTCTCMFLASPLRSYFCMQQRELSSGVLAFLCLVFMTDRSCSMDKGHRHSHMRM